MGQKSYLDTIERAVSNGDVVLIENLEESIDPVLDPLLGRNTIKKGRAIKLGDKEVNRFQINISCNNFRYKLVNV